MNQMTSPMGRIFPEIACQSREIPSAIRKCELINLFIKKQKAKPHKNWAFEIKNTTALHEIIGTTTGIIFFPNKSYWINRIVEEGGTKIINWCRSLDHATPLHLVNTPEEAELLICKGAETHILNSSEEFAIQKIVCASPLTLRLPARSAIYRIFIKYHVPLDEWKPMNGLEQDKYERVQTDVKVREQKIIQFFNAHTFAEEKNPLSWLPREVIHIVVSYYFFRL